MQGSRSTTPVDTVLVIMYVYSTYCIDYLNFRGFHRLLRGGYAEGPNKSEPRDHAEPTQSRRGGDKKETTAMAGPGYG